MIDETVGSMVASLEKTLNPLIEQGVRAALLDFPIGTNVGDNAIWLGEKAFLEKRDTQVLYRCDLHSYSKHALKKAIGDGLILMHGGGNLGDIWEGPQALREEVISSFPTNPIVIFPQTIRFSEPAALERAKRIFGSHPSLTLVARSRSSYEFANENFACQTLLAPDMAFFLDIPRRTGGPTKKIVWLGRTDQESTGRTAPVSEDVHVVDWMVAGRLEEFSSRHRRPWLRAAERSAKGLAKAGLRRFPRAVAFTYDRRAAQNLSRGVDLLRGGQVVVTDRLHAHILCLLAGIPHVLLDNSYGKLSDFYQTWTKQSALAHWADSPEEALAAARALVHSV